MQNIANKVVIITGASSGSARRPPSNSPLKAQNSSSAHAVKINSKPSPRTSKQAAAKPCTA